MTSPSEICDCDLCVSTPNHPAKRFHDAFRRMANCMTEAELAACLVQYAMQSEMGDTADRLLCQIGKIGPDRLAEARRAVERDKAALLTALHRAPDTIESLADDHETKEWLTKVAVAAASGSFDFDLQDVCLSVVLNGHSYRIGLPADWMAYNNLFEVLLNLNYAHECRPVATVYDLGAYIGLSSIYLHSCYPDSEIVAVEPNAANFRVLKRNLEDKSRPIKHRAIDKALAARSGRVGLMSLTDDPDASSMLHSTVFDPSRASMTTVEAIGLADLVNDSGAYGIKLDIEGGEFELDCAQAVLSGAAWILGEFHYGLWSKPSDRWLRDLLHRDFDVSLQMPRLEMSGSGEYFCIGQDFRAVQAERPGAHEIGRQASRERS